MKIDRATAWKAKLPALTRVRWPIRCGHVFSADELARLREGLWPRDMDDRWTVWLDGHAMRCWRSWTGTCIYETHVALGEDGTGAAEVLDVLDDPATYRRAVTDAAKLELFEGILSLVWRRDDDRAALAGVKASGD
ncbi:hypothetical protein ACQRWG_03350 [Stenotrophomonas maltophilia]|uniref:hypothetical protein n=1 Tax=Stenotrophomonas maltophilia TaxID=40324 RepID=UPI000DA9D43E|nr:hypothetical protein [Stenotrophomonas maltophilia]PZT23542.1 hypothetical protein A7X88_15720 [Stenotrophomonas maltophilia]